MEDIQTRFVILDINCVAVLFFVDYVRYLHGHIFENFIYCVREGSVLFNEALNTFYLRLYGKIPFR